MTQEELDKIVEQHQHWLNEDCEGWEGMKADFSRSDLRGTNLLGADRFRLGKVLDEPLVGYKKTKEGVVILRKFPRVLSYFASTAASAAQTVRRLPICADTKFCTRNTTTISNIACDRKSTSRTSTLCTM